MSTNTYTLSEPGNYAVQAVDSTGTYLSSDESNVINDNIYLVNAPDLTKVADAIREKTGSTSQISFPNGMVSEIEDNLVKPEGNKAITNTSSYDVTNFATAQISDSNLKAENIAKNVTILGITGTHEGGIIPTGKINITNTQETDVTNYATAQVQDNNLVAGNIKNGTSILGITGTYETPTETKTVNPSTSTQTVTPTTGKHLSSVTVNAVTSSIDSNIKANNIASDTTILGVTGSLVRPSGTINISSNGTHNVTNYASANVNVQPNLQQKTATTNGDVTPDSGYDGLSKVTVAIPTYDGSSMGNLYDITPTLTNVTADAGNASYVKSDKTVTLTYYSDEGYNLPQSVSVTGATVASWTVTDIGGYTLTIDSWRQYYSNALHLTLSDGTQTTVTSTGTVQNVRSIDSITGGDSTKYVYINSQSITLPYTLTQNTTATVNCTCLSGDTLVTMSDYTTKRLDEIEIDDEILSYDWDTMKLIPNKVVFTDKDENQQYNQYDIWTFDDGTSIKTIHRHEFYNIEAQKFKYMDEWNIGEHTYKIDGTTPALISHEVVNETINHYKITGEHGTNYFANGLLTGDRNCPTNIIFKET